ncbi:MAG: hypothetical protein HW403_1307 [Dehalococcoidia bacterium]|nr:hypothetical protein [Dehalococcoidia bacterium]
MVTHILAIVLWLDVWVAIALSALSLLLIWALRSWRACLLRGVRGGPEGEDPRSEMEFPAAATVALAVGWGALHDPWMAFLAIAFMAWGDASAGLVRAWMNGSRYQAITASAAMLSVSLGSVWIFHPSVAGAAAAVTATFAEAFWPLTRSRLNDSWPVVGSAIGLMALDRVGWVAFLH